MHIKFNSIRMHDDSNELLLAEGVCVSLYIDM